MHIMISFCVQTATSLAAAIAETAETAATATVAVAVVAFESRQTRYSVSVCACACVHTMWSKRDKTETSNIFNNSIVKAK